MKIRVLWAAGICLLIALVLLLWLRPSAQDLKDACRFTGELAQVLLTPASSVHAQLEAELDKIRQAGEPLTMVAAAPPQVPEGENAALLYELAFEQLDLPERGSHSHSEFLMSPGQSLDSNTPLHTTMQRLVAKNAVAIELLEAAANRPACRFPVDWSVPGADYDLRHRRNLRDCATLLRARMILDAERGQMEQALETARVSLALGEAIRDEPAIISQLVRFSIDDITLSGLEAALSERPGPTDVCIELHDYLRQMEFVDPFVHSFCGKRAAGIEFFDLVRHDRTAAAALIDEAWAEPYLNWYFGHFWGPKMLDRDEVVYLRIMSEYVDAAAKYWRQHPNMADLEAQDEFGSFLLGVCPVTRLLLGAWCFIPHRRDCTIARIGLAQGALALKAYRNEKGRYPESLADLSKVIEWADLPEDPFTGENFIYRREDEGFVVYSIGGDFRDDGGRRAAEHWEKGDIVWRCAN